MMSTQKLYDQWSATYDEVENKTRDLEKLACEQVLSGVSFENVIELGGGTGKNTAWLAERAKRVLSLDLSEEMQAIAKSKVTASNVEFRLADVTQEWTFSEPADLITCSLILEHVKDLEHIFREASKVLRDDGHFYICELHPFKQYAGSKARFETSEGTQVLECFRHHVTDYTNAALGSGFEIAGLDEWFDDDAREQIPRLLSFLFRKVSVART
ncbi:MAG TPA: methyltransferase domain-containing protein [Pyrinomonadaceae bacterium]|nr:methyltransferase domain-containing protein [Pyrinomonadaceae bacterium]